MTPSEYKKKIPVLKFFYILMWPVAWVVYFASGRPFGFYSIDYVCWLAPRSVHNALELVALVESSADGKPFRSNLAQKYNNYTGMHQPTIRLTLSKGSTIADGGANCATYSNYFDCAADWMLWLLDKQTAYNTLKALPISSIASIGAAGGIIVAAYESASVGGYAIQQNWKTVNDYNHWHIMASILGTCLLVWALVWAFFFRKKPRTRRRKKKLTARPTTSIFKSNGGRTGQRLIYK